MTRSESLSRAEARRIALAAQGFNGRRGSGESRWSRVGQAIDRMGLLQIDSVSAVVRSHYLPAYSRIGRYRTGDLDRRAFARKRRQYFEYWAHECSLVPLALHPLLRWRMEQAARGQGIYKGLAAFVRENKAYVKAVLTEVESRGPLSARELSDPGERGGPWWGWKRGKIALEYLFWAGAVTTAERRGFERIYDLPERVIPEAVLALPTPEPAEARRLLVARAARALGVATLSDLRDYFRLAPADSRKAVETLVEAGELLPVSVKGWKQGAYIHRDARVPGRLTASALLSPFDPLVWERSRTERLFGFDYRLEIYTPEHKRRYGYYVLPFLFGERLTARVDLRADRKAGHLKIEGAFAEPKVDPQRLAPALAGELRLLAGWLGLEQLSLGRRGDMIAPLKRALAASID